jgi:hypothetical protein
MTYHVMEKKIRWKGVPDRTAWSGRGASFVAKLNATKVVWFSVEPCGRTKTVTTTPSARHHGWRLGEPVRDLDQRQSVRIAGSPRRPRPEAGTDVLGP